MKIVKQIQPEMPSVDELIKMAKEAPEQLDKLQTRLSEDLVNKADPRYKARIEALHHRIQLERAQSTNAVDAMLSLTDMMQEKFWHLDKALQAFLNYDKDYFKAGTILKFPEHRPASLTCEQV